MGALPIISIFFIFALVIFILLFAIFGSVAHGFIFLLGYLATLLDIIIMLYALKPYLMLIAKAVRGSEGEDSNEEVSKTEEIAPSSESVSFNGFSFYLKNIFRWVLIAIVLLGALSLAKSFDIENYIIYFIIGIALPFLIFIAIGVYLLITKKRILFK